MVLTGVGKSISNVGEDGCLDEQGGSEFKGNLEDVLGYSILGCAKVRGEISLSIQKAWQIDGVGISLSSQRGLLVPGFGELRHELRVLLEGHSQCHEGRQKDEELHVGWLEIPTSESNTGYRRWCKNLVRTVGLYAKLGLLSSWSSRDKTSNAGSLLFVVHSVNWLGAGLTVDQPGWTDRIRIFGFVRTGRKDGERFAPDCGHFLTALIYSEILWDIHPFFCLLMQ